jgi:hypothetical protein
MYDNLVMSLPMGKPLKNVESTSNMPKIKSRAAAGTRNHHQVFEGSKTKINVLKVHLY